jgi:UDP-N-acetylmuramate: L-alanyl-gamma-D-glutamyl-meso-diaminopimelate ligase
VVVAGTHGKTTTSSAIAWSLFDTGVDPSYFIGGIPRNTKQGYRIGQGPFCVLEGDEYDTACFDKHPKAFHYAPFGLVFTHVEFDHADIYRDLGHVRDAFRFLASLVPPEGFLLASSEIQGLHGLLEGFRGRMYTFGDCQNDAFSIRDFRHTGDGACFRVVGGTLGQEVSIETPLRGMFNARNLTAAFGVSLLLGAAVRSAAQSLQAFHGVRRRVEILAETGHATVIEDFAHHPTAVRAVLTAIRDSYPNRELRVIFEPRSNTMRRRVLQGALIDALCLADAVFLRPPDRLDTVPEDERIDPQEVVQTLQSRGVKACIEPDTDRLVEKTLTLLGSPFVLVILSNADTHAFKERILEAFAREKA